MLKKEEKVPMTLGLEMLRFRDTVSKVQYDINISFYNFGTDYLNQKYLVWFGLLSSTLGVSKCFCPLGTVYTGRI